MIHVRRWGRTARLAAVLAALLTVSLGPLLAQPASAAASCTGTSSIRHGTITFAIPTTTPNSGNVNCSLSQGNNSAAVGSLQSQLNLCYGPGSGGFPGHVAVFSPALGVDGDFGAKTAAALRAVQAHHHIGADGIYGPQTRSTINFFAEDAGGVERCVRFGA